MTKVQDLLDLEARLSNEGRGDCQERLDAHQQIKQLRGDDPRPCWGEDDCSTNFLMRCPWRIDCGGEENIKWRRSTHE